MTSSGSNCSKTKVAVLAAEAEFEQSVQATFGAAAAQIELTVHTGLLAAQESRFGDNATVIVLDINPADPQELAALQRLMGRVGGRTPVVVVMPALTQDVVRQLMQMRVADFLVKPIAPAELVRACARVVQASTSDEQSDAEILTFLPAVGGAGVTTVAIQSALLLLEGKSKSRETCCLVDLDFQHGACTDYLDLEPRLDLNEIEARPERLDRQLLEVMIAHHSSGLAVIAAPNRAAEMRLFDPELVTRLLDLVASHFDNVVIDMPRTWFSWTDSVLLGSNRVFIISEMTVPSVKQARQLATAICERLGEGPRPQIIVNRFEQHLFGSSLRRADIENALGENFAGVLPNDYRLVREAIDRGVPLAEIKTKNKITSQLRKMIIQAPEQSRFAHAHGLSRLTPSWAR